MLYGEFDTKSLMIGGRGGEGGEVGETRDYIHIFIITDCIKINLFPKQINCAEYENVII